jgi:O-antigen ligase/tetratricopeptide (TPR) repeat protein
MTRNSAVRFFKAISYIGVYGGLLMPLVFIPVVIFPFVFSKLIAFQILVGITFPAYLALAWMEPKYRPPKSALFTAILAYFLAIALSVVFSVDPVRSWWGNQERMNGLFTLLHLLAWLVMAVGTLKTWTDWRRLLNFESVLAVFMAIVALLQIPYPRLLLFQASTRVGGLLDNPIYMGVYQMFNLFFLVLLFLKTNSKSARIWYLIAAAIDLGAFFAAESRGPLVGLGVTIFVFALFYAIFTTNKKAKTWILSAAGSCFGLYAVVFMLRGTAFVMGNSILSRLTNFSTSTGTRFIAWDIAWKGFLERPLTGWGFDAFHILFNKKYNPVSLEYSYYETWFDRAHNTVLDALSMTGIFGFVTYFAIFAALFYVVWRAYKKNWIDLPVAAVFVALPIGYFVQNLFVFDHPAAFSMSFLLYALVIGATRPEFAGKKEDLPAAASSASEAVPRATPWTLFGILQIIMLIVVWRYSVLPFQASVITIRANILSSSNPDAAWTLMKQAGTIPTPYLDEQTFLLSQQLITIATSGQAANQPRFLEMYQYAKQITERFLADHPENTHTHFIYARLIQEVIPLLPKEQQSEEIALCEREFKRAIDTSPKRQQLFYSLARLYSMTGRKDESRETLQQALDFDKNIGESWWYLGVTDWFDYGRTDQGADEVLNAMKAKSRYTLQTVRDAAIVGQAAVLKHDTETLKSLLPMLPNLAGGSTSLYIDIARMMESAGLIQERNEILNALQQIQPSISPQLEGLRNGTATSINASILMAPVVKTPDPKPAIDASTTTTQAETPAATVASSVGAVKGPRR